MKAVNYEELTWQERITVRGKYVKYQKNRCMFCLELFSNDPPDEITDKKIDWTLFPPNFLKYPIHLQHNHDTDMTEGAVHAYCNAVLWQYERR